MIIDFLKQLFNIKKENTMIEIQKDILSLDDLYTINGKMNKDKCELYISSMNEILPQNNIDTPLRICHFLAQIIHESGHLKSNSENLNYSAKALISVFGKYFKTDAESEKYARKPEMIANKVYANRMGNGNEVSGDGWKYRGRGLIQLTGKTNYINCGKDLNIDIVNNPDLLLEPKYSLLSACWFWNKNSLNTFADKDDIIAITKKINGGTNGLSDRQKNLYIAKSIIFKE